MCDATVLYAAGHLTVNVSSRIETISKNVIVMDSTVGCIHAEWRWRCNTTTSATMAHTTRTTPATFCVSKPGQYAHAPPCRV